MHRDIGTLDLAAEIRRVDGNHSFGAAELAEALAPYLARSVDESQDARIQHALDFFHPDLDVGTFAASDWAIQIANILTGGKPPSATQWVRRALPDALLHQLAEESSTFELGKPPPFYKDM